MSTSWVPSPICFFLWNDGTTRPQPFIVKQACSGKNTWANQNPRIVQNSNPSTADLISDEIFWRATHDNKRKHACRRGAAIWKASSCCGCRCCGLYCFVSGDLKNRCDPSSRRNRLRTEISVHKAERAKPLRTENGSWEFNSHDPNWTLINSGLAGKPCEPNKVHSANWSRCDLRSGAQSCGQAFWLWTDAKYALVH